MQPEHTDAGAGGAATARPEVSRRGGPAGWMGHLQGFGPILGLVLLCIAGTALNSSFADISNIMNVLTRTSFIGIISVGMCFVIISGGIDLSVGSMVALIAGSMILIMNSLIAVVASPVWVIVLGMVFEFGRAWGRVRGGRCGEM